MSRAVRVSLGLVVVACGLVMIYAPLAVADVLHRPPASQPAMINLRASWGGTVLGLGAFLAWLPALRPVRRAVLGLLGWAMAGIAFARINGFVLDGGADRRQWVFLIVELVIAAGCAVLLRRGRAASPPPS